MVLSAWGQSRADHGVEHRPRQASRLSQRRGDQPAVDELLARQQADPNWNQRACFTRRTTVELQGRRKDARAFRSKPASRPGTARRVQVGVVLRDISVRKREASAFKYLAEHDTLTGLPEPQRRFALIWSSANGDRAATTGTTRRHVVDR